MMFLLIAAAAAQPTWTGAYALTLETVTVAEVPMIGEMLTFTRSTMLAEIAPSGDGWRQTHRVCDVRIENNSKIARTVLPQVFIQSMALEDYPVSFTEGDDGWRYAADMGQVDIGFDPSLTQVVPGAYEDVGVIDWDKDGQPAATVEIEIPVFKNVGLHVTQRSRVVADGQLAADGGIAGRARMVEFEQFVLGASNRLFTHAPDIVPLPERGTFSMRPVAAGTTCAQLKPPG